MLLGVIQLCVGCSGRSRVVRAVSGLWHGYGCPLPCSFNRWVVSCLYYRCDVACSLRCIVESVLYCVPSFVAVAPGFYCRQMCYGVLVIGGVSWGLWQILHRVCPVQEPVSHCLVRFIFVFNKCRTLQCMAKSVIFHSVSVSGHNTCSGVDQ